MRDMIKRAIIPTSNLPFGVDDVSWAYDTTSGDFPLIVVEVNSSGKPINIVDGFHRAAGLRDAKVETANVVLCRAESEDEDNLIAAAADPAGYAGISQADALTEIYARANK
jgi:hypothetical protein